MKFFKILCLIFLSAQLVAQEFEWKSELEYNQAEKSGKSYIDYHLLSGDESGFSRLVVQKSALISNPEIFIEWYDAAFKFVKKVDIYHGPSTNKMFIDVILANNKIHLFSALPGDDKTYTLKAQVFDYEGVSLRKERDLDVITGTKTLSLGEFFVAVSKNGEHFASVAIPIYKRKTKETLQVKTYNERLEETFGEHITLEYPRKRFVYNTPFILNDGTMFMYKHQKIKKRGRVREMYILDKAKKKLVGSEMRLDSEHDFVMLDDEMMENNAGNLIFAGLHKKAAKMQAPSGVYYLEYNNKGEVVRTVTQDFPKKPKLGFTGLQIKKIELLDTDELIYYSHQYSKNSSTDPNNSSKLNFSYKGSNMIITRLNKEELVFSTLVERKEQESKGGRDKTLDFVWMHDKSKDEIVVIYNQITSVKVNFLIATKINRPVVVTIQKDGETEITDMFSEEFGINPREKAYVFSTDEFHQIGNTLLVKANYGYTYKFGVFRK